MTSAEVVIICPEYYVRIKSPFFNHHLWVSNIVQFPGRRHFLLPNNFNTANTIPPWISQSHSLDISVTRFTNRLNTGTTRSKKRAACSFTNYFLGVVFVGALFGQLLSCFFVNRFYHYMMLISTLLTQLPIVPSFPRVCYAARLIVLHLATRKVNKSSKSRRNM